MCVIMIKPKGKEMVDQSTLKQMWERNKDGAGFMYLNKENKVVISKGYMTFEDFERGLNGVDDIDSVNETPMILHFRITTHGGTSPENTHPFPVSSKVEHLQALEVSCKLGMVHNGVINSVDTSKDLSDTMMFIKDVIAPLRKVDKDFLNTFQKLISYGIGASKLAFLDSNGEITTFGTFQEVDGYQYSNLNHVPSKVTTYSAYNYSTSKNLLGREKKNTATHPLKEGVIYQTQYQTFFYYNAKENATVGMLYSYRNPLKNNPRDYYDVTYEELMAASEYSMTDEAKEVMRNYAKTFSCCETFVKPNTFKTEKIYSGDYLLVKKDFLTIKANTILYVDDMNLVSFDLIDTMNDVLYDRVDEHIVYQNTEVISNDDLLIYIDFMQDYYRDIAMDYVGYEKVETLFDVSPLLGNNDAGVVNLKLKKVAIGVNLIYETADVMGLELTTTEHNWFYDIQKSQFYYLTKLNALHEVAGVEFADIHEADNKYLTFLQGTRRFKKYRLYTTTKGGKWYELTVKT